MLEAGSRKGKKFFNRHRGPGFLVLIFGLWPLVSGLCLNALTIAEIQEKMSESSRNVKSLSFSYIQELRSSLSPEVKFFSGSAAYLKPLHFRLDQTQPEPQTVVSSGKNVLIYTPRFRQAIKNSWSKWLSENLLFPGLSTFSDVLKKLKEEYQWEILGERELNGEKTICLRLKAKSSSGEQFLILYLGSEDFLPRKTEWVAETLSLSTTILSLKINPSFSPQFFRFLPPKGTSIVELP